MISRSNSNRCGSDTKNHNADCLMFGRAALPENISRGAEKKQPEYDTHNHDVNTA